MVEHGGYLIIHFSGKLRVVIYGTATFQGVSLNTELVKGPDLLTSLVGVLL